MNVKNQQILECCGLSVQILTDAESAHGCQHLYEISNNYSNLVL